ncbi:L-1,2-propanediol oxidoreductase [Salmonella enterica subsp. enterica]|uniref:L-1,2-propanediol oxidoreductase n=1 Tax=Salmonella enterica I TaxID=59201 RepID=A0A3S4GFN4_SALET|nr:L-1,2-propanediol oxidoreductase [Salmonella enterica subsp. enterica]
MCAVWKGYRRPGKPSVPIMAIPTTAGTAAEVTINYVITDEEKRRKIRLCRSA